MGAAAVDSACTLDDRLVAFLARRPGVERGFITAILPHLQRAARAQMRGEAAFLRGEVVNQAVVILLENPCRFDPRRGAAAAFLAQVVREGARVVRASYAPPGAPKRSRGAPAAAAPVPLEELTEQEWQRSAQVHEQGFEATEARCEAARLIRKMPPSLALAFARIADGDSKVAVAAELGIDRFALERRMTRFRLEVRPAA